KQINKKPENQASLFGGIMEVKAPEFRLRETAEATQVEKLAWEKELLGLYISGHPLDRLRDKLKDKPQNIKKIREELGNGHPVTIGGMIATVKPIITKKNDRMAFLTIEDLTGSMEAVIFQNFLPRTQTSSCQKNVLPSQAKSLSVTAKKAS
ncbi:MAG: OB-fold nucleic acid binding domain-containing protein, partial [Candidatus Paceibacterota bacterium]